MMRGIKKRLSRWAPLALCLSLAACAAPSSVPGRVLLRVDSLATGSQPSRPAVLRQADGTPALVYATPNQQRIRFQRGTAPAIELDTTARVQGGNRFQLVPGREPGRLYTFWWSHQDGKSVYFTHSDDNGQSFGPVAEVNDDHGVLPPFSLLQGPGNVLGMTYEDERVKKYAAYFNRSADAGRSWARPDQRLDAPPAEGGSSDVHDPYAVELGPDWFVAWTESAREPDGLRYRIVARRSSDAGLHWSEPQVLYRSKHQISAFALAADGERVVLAADDHSEGVVALLSTDRGQTWRVTPPAPGSQAQTNSGTRVAIGGGRAHLVWSVDRTGGLKPAVYTASLDLAEARWIGEARRLDLKAVEQSLSSEPEIVALPSGVLVASWTDYRDIRPNIYLAASFDAGVNWTPPQPVLAPGRLAAGRARPLAWGEALVLAYEEYPNDLPMQGRFVLRELPLDLRAARFGDFGHPPPPSEEARRARLEARVQALWSARVAGDYEPTYDMFDFAFKAARPKSNYLESVGVITYHGFQTEGVDIQGNEAKVKMKIKYEMKPTMLPTGREVKVLPVEVEVTNTWVWVGDDWYLKFEPAVGEPLLKY